MTRLISAVVAVAVAHGVCADVVLTNDLAVMTLDGAARLKSLVVRADGRELIGRVRPFCTAEGERPMVPERLERRGADTFAYVFPAKDGGGEIVCRATSFGPGWTFELVSCSSPAIRRIVFADVGPACTRHLGWLANMWSDDRHGVCLRSYQTKGRMRATPDGKPIVTIDRERGFDGLSVGLVAARRSDLVSALRRMTEVAGVPRTAHGGAWSLGAEGNRGSYCFANLHAFAVDDWIDFALRGGFSTIHLHGWWKSLGHYDLHDSRFPNGVADWTNVCARIHAAGLKVGMHCLTGAISPRDAWMTPRCREEFLDRSVLTLARDLSPTDAVMYVEEPVDIDRFNTFHSYSSRGNTFRVGTELIQYSGVMPKPPYGFTGMKRGAWETEKGGTIPAGTKLHYLYQRYGTFFPLPDSRLAGEVAEAIGAKRALGNVDLIYMDGAEAVREDANYTEDRYREQIVGRLGRDMIVEGSNGDAFAWWYLSRYGAWDRPYWGLKRMHDDHLTDVERARTRNLLEAQMGWWHPETGNETHPGHKLDEMEYFAARNAACDTASSTQGTDICGPRPLPFTVSQQITLLGWYERFRLARAFSDAAAAKLAKPRQETRLRQDQHYGWRLWSCDSYFHRVAGPDSQAWTWDIGTKAASAGLRVEALYYADTASTNLVKLFSGADVAALKKPYAAKDVSGRHAAGSDPKIGPTLVIDAKSSRTAARGGELCLMREWTEQPYFSIKGCYAFGLWVKGDGSGADLWIMLESAPLYSWGQSFHRVKLDFTGWRMFTFPLRERDISDAFGSYWTQGIHPMVTCATVLRVEHLKSVRFYLNELPPGRDVHVEVSEVVAMPAVRKTVKNPVVKLGGADVSVPFEMTSGDFAELEDGVWRHYDEGGDIIGMASGTMPLIGGGPSAVRFDGRAEDGAQARAEVTLFAQHSPVPALKPRGSMDKSQLRQISYEAAMPSVYCPSKGLETLEPLYVRPGEKARIELTVHGPVSKPTITYCGEKWTFDVDLGRHDRLYCRDGISWHVARGPKRRPDAAGRLDRKLPVLMGGKTVLGFESAEPGKADSRIDIVKRYTDEPSWFEEHQIGVKSSLDGTEQPSYFFPAPGATSTNRAPLLVLFHTWSYNMWDLTEIYHGAIVDCRRRGWSLLCPNFRGPNCTPQGCGSDLATGDVKDAVEWVKANYPVDEDRVYAMGGSGGGHMTLLLAGRYPDIWAGCAAFCPPADLLEWHPASKALRHQYWKHLEKACGGAPEERREEYAHRSPITYADEIRRKGVNVMLVTGIHDGIPGKGSVPVSIVSRMYNALADEKDRISEETIRYMAQNEAVPAAERFAGNDPFYGGRGPVLLRRTSGNVQYTVFKGAHGGNEAAALWWLARQRRGVRADWTLPKTAVSGYREFTK